MAGVEPIIVVLGPFGGGTTAVAKVLHHLDVFMGAEFDWAYREPHETWEDSRLSRLCGRAFSVPGGQLPIPSRRNFAVGPTIIAVLPAARDAFPALSTRFSVLRWILFARPGARWCRLWWTDHSRK